MAGTAATPSGRWPDTPGCGWPPARSRRTSPHTLADARQAEVGPQVQTVLRRDGDGRTSVLERLSLNPADPGAGARARSFADGTMPGQGELAQIVTGVEASRP